MDSLEVVDDLLIQLASPAKATLFIFKIYNCFFIIKQIVFISSSYKTNSPKFQCLIIGNIYFLHIGLNVAGGCACLGSAGFASRYQNRFWSTPNLFLFCDLILKEHGTCCFWGGGQTYTGKQKRELPLKACA